MLSAFGYDRKPSLDFNILVNLFAVIDSLIVESLIELLTAVAAYVTCGLVWVDTQFSWPYVAAEFLDVLV